MSQYEQELQKKTVLALEVDNNFKDYSITWRPEDARIFIRQSITGGAVHDQQAHSLLSWIDQTVPPGVLSKFVHTYGIGRENGKRMVRLYIAKPTLPDYDFETLSKTLEGFGLGVGALVDVEESDLHYDAKFTWS